HSSVLGPDGLLAALPGWRQHPGVVQYLAQQRGRVTVRRLLHVSPFVARDLDQEAVRTARAGAELRDLLCARPLVAVLDQEPGGFAVSRTSARAHENPGATQLLALQQIGRESWRERVA